MFLRNKGTTIAEGLKVKGTITAEGLVKVHGHVEGDLHCTSLIISRKASITGGIEADHVVVNGRVKGPIRGGHVLLKSDAHVVGDIEHQALAIEKGAYFDGRSVRSPSSNVQNVPEKVPARPRREAHTDARVAAPAA
jgi:cytoskeletal protein CcmA (bactofilin family)